MACAPVLFYHHDVDTIDIGDAKRRLDHLRAQFSGEFKSTSKSCSWEDDQVITRLFVEKSSIVLRQHSIDDIRSFDHSFEYATHANYDISSEKPALENLSKIFDDIESILSLEMAGPPYLRGGSPKANDIMNSIQDVANDIETIIRHANPEWKSNQRVVVNPPFPGYDGRIVSEYGKKKLLDKNLEKAFLEKCKPCAVFHLNGQTREIKPVEVNSLGNKDTSPLEVMRIWGKYGFDSGSKPFLKAALESGKSR